MYYFTSTDFLITLFGYHSSLDFYNRIENLTRMTKFRGPPMGGGGWGSASYASKSRRPWSRERGREVSRARGHVPTRCFEANVKSLILIIGAPQDLFFNY